MLRASCARHTMYVIGAADLCCVRLSLEWNEARYCRYGACLRNECRVATDVRGVSLVTHRRCHPNLQHKGPSSSWSTLTSAPPAQFITAGGARGVGRADGINISEHAARSETCLLAECASLPSTATRPSPEGRLKSPPPPPRPLAHYSTRDYSKLPSAGSRWARACRFRFAACPILHVH